MFLAGSTVNIVYNAMYAVFVQWMDSFFYLLLQIIFDMFFVIARFDLFGSTSFGVQLYDSFSKRVYMIVSIVMVFIFAYNLLLYVMRPDGNYVSEKLKPTMLLRRISFSMILLVLSPLIFKYMSVFQSHVVASDTIPAIVLGKEAGSGKALTKGHKFTAMTWMTFAHPKGTYYGDFIANPDATTCAEYYIDPNSVANEKKQFVQGLIQACNIRYFDVKQIVMNVTFLSDQVEYWPIVSTIGAIIFIIFGIGYIYSISGRIFRLFVLQIFAPIPIIMRTFNKEKNFDPWLKDLIGTYLDLFIRIGVISFVLYIASIVPVIINAIEDAALTELLMG